MTAGVGPRGAQVWDVDAAGRPAAAVGHLVLPLDGLLRARRVAGDLPLEPGPRPRGVPAAPTAVAIGGGGGGARPAAAAPGARPWTAGEAAAAATAAAAAAAAALERGGGFLGGAAAAAAEGGGGGAAGRCCVTADIRLVGRYGPGERELLAALRLLGFESAYGRLRDGGFRSVADLYTVYLYIYELKVYIYICTYRVGLGVPSWTCTRCIL